MPAAPFKSAAKKAAAAAVTTATSLAWKRLSWQARAALMGGSFALGAARRLNSIRHRLAGHHAKDGGRRRHLFTTTELMAAALPI
jgi:hypothetical protein